MSLKSIIFGRRLASDEDQAQKIGVFAGLPALGLDGLSSSAYGPEAALAVLAPMGAAGLGYIGPITWVILAILIILYFSYRQTIAAYPVNGGSYTVAKENLGTWTGLLAAAALMLDYILTVAVGISAGIAALVSAVPKLHPYTLLLCLAVLVVITLANLRGTGEAGSVFAVPTYLFIACMIAVLGVGIVKAVHSGGHPQPVSAPPHIFVGVESVGAWLLLRAFASGCAAMTGVEAVSNGVSAFKEPTVQNAHRTLTCIVGILIFLLGTIAFLTHAYGIGAMDQERGGYQSVLSQLTAAVMGRRWIYRITIASVLCVLCLSANTSFVGFPRLCGMIAKDDFLPRAFASVGRRLVYSAGILFLAGASAALLIAFRGITDKLIPLYAVGAFLAFTLSQSGMVMHWCRERTNSGNASASSHPRKVFPILVNASGAIATAAALVIILIAKFTYGAWVTVVAIPLMLLVFWLVHRHYAWVEKQVACHDRLNITRSDPPVVLVPMHRWCKPVAKSLEFALQVSPDIIAIHLSKLEEDEAENEKDQMKLQWAEKVEAPVLGSGLNPPKLEFVRTPYRRFVTPIMAEIDKALREFPNRFVVVVLPEVIEEHWWQRVLHGRRAVRLRTALRAREDFRVVVIELPWFLHEPIRGRSI